ncbi:MAG: MerR family DNA-binding transcriptional regulator, partial [candidate division Zixibacteria bacterium]|nr:MerR family DNA-binding transcriptional regulator [candidate division Zixibacteria bacterium]
MTLTKQESNEMLNTKQAAISLGVSTKTIYRMEEKGLIHSMRTPGGQRRFTKYVIQTYLDRSRDFIAPQNPSKYRNPLMVRENGNTYALFKEGEVQQEAPIRKQIDRLERIVSLNSSHNHQQHYDKEVNPKRWVEEWDFKTYHTQTYTHGFHNYPAMFIPQVARKLILAFSKESDLVCDIFCGSGTTLVESSLLNRNSIGIELNPLAVLIARVKTTPIDPKTLTNRLKAIINDYQHIKNMELPSFANLEFWFSKNVIKDLSRLRQAIWNISEENIRDFFSICFSEVVRIVSYTRHNEFKLFRSPDKLTDKFKPDVLREFIKMCENNIIGMKEYVRDVLPQTYSRIIMGDAIKDNGIPHNSVDFIITSPPYGDSRTTVAYGQFSRLSSQWLDLLPPNVKDLDKELMGGKNNVDINDPILEQSNTLKYSIKTITEKDKARAKDVLSFYIDLDKALKQAHNILKPHRYFCVIIGNRTVKELVLKTDAIICELGERIGFTTQSILYRNIPNKRMPLRNSPTNEAGKTGST